MRVSFRRLLRLFAYGGALLLPVAAAAPVNVPVVSAGVVPNAVNMLDCNGWSSKYEPTKETMRMLCVDPYFKTAAGATRAYDNGWYIGHDEPSVKFVSAAHGSGNHMTYVMQLAVDPKSKPTPSGSVTDYAELSPAPWFGLPICDPNSYPMNACQPDSDTNTGMGAASDAGSAFMELQFYAPGFGPFQDAISCDAHYYCAAMNIDSLECNLNFVTCNPNCFEPVNFSYLQTDGVPTGPPSPQLINQASFLANKHTLRMRGGDVLRVTLQDTSQGFKTTVVDVTSGQTGYMVASARNGFMNTDPTSCNGTPYNFHPEYNTASQQNQVPWAALEGGVLMEQEIGHFETCKSVGGGSLAQTFPSLSFDPAIAQTCNGGIEPGSTGEGCDFTTGICASATTQGGGPCANSANPSLSCEFSDAFCIPSGSRTLTLNGQAQTWSWPVAGCETNFTQNGDLDFDGNSYIADWPNGSSKHPTTFRYAGPFDAHGNPYPSVQFETDVAGSENNCDVFTGAGCTALPGGAAFYPYWTLGRSTSGSSALGGGCTWNFGNTIPGTTINAFGGDAEYGTPNLARYAGTVISPVMANPQLRCSES